VKEKIYEIPIDQPLTAKRRKTIDKYILGNAHLLPFNVKLTHEWDGDDDEILRINTPPVAWEVIFASETVGIYGSGPLWARLLFTKKKQELLKEQIELLLHATGFIGDKPNAAKAVFASKRAK
jgi:hypothetical protein